MKKVPYEQETKEMIRQFSEEDRAYFDELWSYFMLAGFVYDEASLREQVYNIVLDFKEAETEGTQAKDYFGEDPKALANQIIKAVPRASLSTWFETIGIVGGGIIFYRLLSDFSSRGEMTILPLLYVFDIAFSFIMGSLLLFLLQKTMFTDDKRDRHYTYLMFGTIFAYMIVEGSAKHFIPELGAFSLALPWDILLMVCLVGFLIAKQGKKKEFRGLLYVVGTLFGIGLLTRLFQALQISNPFTDAILPVLLIFVALYVFYRSAKKSLKDLDE